MTELLKELLLPQSDDLISKDKELLELAPELLGQNVLYDPNGPEFWFPVFGTNSVTWNWLEQHFTNSGVRPLGGHDAMLNGAPMTLGTSILGNKGTSILVQFL